MSTDQLQWLQAIAAVAQAIAAFILIGVTYNLSQRSVEISERQKDISDSIYKNAQEIDEQIRKKVSVVLQLKLIEIEDALLSFTNQGNCYFIVNLDPEINVNAEMLIKYLTVKEYKELLDVLKTFKSLHRGIGESPTGFGYLIPEDAKTNANRIIDMVRKLRFALSKIIDIDSGLNLV